MKALEKQNVFRARDNYSIADNRLCYKLKYGEAIELELDVGVRDIIDGMYEVCFAGSLELFDSHCYCHKHINSIIAVKVNDTLIYDGIIHWRSHEETASFWQIFHFHFPASLLRSDKNKVKLINKTSSKKLGRFFDKRIAEELGARVAENKISTLYISDVDIRMVFPAKSYPIIRGMPRAAIEGEAFTVEVATGLEKIKPVIVEATNLKVKEQGIWFEFGEYRALFELKPITAGNKCNIMFDVAGNKIAACLPIVYRRCGKLTELITGPGVETTYWNKLFHGIEDCFANELGNAIRISIDGLLNDLHHIEPAEFEKLIIFLNRRNRYCALQMPPGRVPPYSKITKNHFKKYADILGKKFAGVSIVEPILFFHHYEEGKQRDLKLRTEAFKKFFAYKVKKTKLQGHKLVTFDHARGLAGYYYELGVDLQISELGPACNILEEASSRGAARAYGKDWGVTMAMLWYAGQGAQYAYDEARVRYAHLVMFHSYLAGARQILWEGGMFDNFPVYNFILSKESWRDFYRTYDDLMMIKAREGFNNLLNFQRAQQLIAPMVDYGVVRGNYDMPISYSDAASWYGDMSIARAWALLKVFIPHFAQGVRAETGRKMRRWYSMTPYGQVDIVPAEASKEAFRRYKFLSLLGWNTMTKELYEKLLDYVQSGGILFISIPHFTTDTYQKLEWNFFNRGDVSDLCGVKIIDIGGRIEEVKFIDKTLKNTYGNSFKMSQKNPLFVQTFDEIYPVFGLDVTYFGAELENRSAEILAVSQDNDPVILRNKVGRGKVYLLNSYFHPGRGNFQKLAEMVMRHIISSDTPPELKIKDEREVISWFKYPEKGFDRYFLINTDWASGQSAKANIRLKKWSFDLSLNAVEPVQLACSEKALVIIKEPYAQIVDWRKHSGTEEITIFNCKSADIKRYGQVIIKHL